MNRTLLLLTIFLTYLGFSQDGSNPFPENSESLKGPFKEWKFGGHVRNYFLSTANEGDLRDYYTDAVGGAISLETREYHRFKAGVKGSLVSKVFSSDLNQADALTGKISKWEHELYDITDPQRLDHLVRLEEFYLKYQFSDGFAGYGKMEIPETALLNKSDGRMNPFAFQGFWSRLRQREQELSLAWLHRVSPRSTFDWYDFNEAIGLFNNGFQPTGEAADYHLKTRAAGIAILQYKTRLKNWGFHLNHWYLSRLMNTTLFQLDYERNLWDFGLQYAFQIPDSFQRNLSYSERYFQPEERGKVLSIRLGYQPSNWNLAAAYSHTFASGRFLFPRELGRDQFFTSITRSRLEGFGKADVLTISGDYHFPSTDLSIGLEFTEIAGPETGQYEFNKYNLDAYRQLNTRFHYEAKGFLEGLNLELLYVYRENSSNRDPAYVFNISNYHQLNFVTNYKF